jgi:hypothetical protein
MSRTALLAVSAFTAALMLSLPASACTSDCNPPDVDLILAEGYICNPNHPESSEVVRGVNFFGTVQDKTWEFAGDLVGLIESDIRYIMHTNSDLFTVREWGTIYVESLSGLDLDPGVENTILVRTTAQGYLPVISAHFEIVGGTGYFANVVGYGDAEVDLLAEYAEYVFHIGFE